MTFLDQLTAAGHETKSNFIEDGFGKRYSMWDYWVPTIIVDSQQQLLK